MNPKFDPFVMMVEGAMARVNEERKAAATNMRLGQFIDALEALDASLPVTLVDGRGVGGFMSYRGYYEDLAISPRADVTTVGEILRTASNALGECFEGYKGGDFYMNKDTILWVAEYGCSGGNMLTGVKQEGERVVIETTLHPDYL